MTTAKKKEKQAPGKKPLVMFLPDDVKEALAAAHKRAEAAFGVSLKLQQVAVGVMRKGLGLEK